MRSGSRIGQQDTAAPPSQAQTSGTKTATRCVNDDGGPQRTVTGYIQLEAPSRRTHNLNHDFIWMLLAASIVFVRSRHRVKLEPSNFHWEVTLRFIILSALALICQVATAETVHEVSRCRFT